MSRIARVVRGTFVPGRGVSTPRKPSDFQVNRNQKSARERSSLVREGNRAIPVQPIYENVADDEEGGA